MWKSEKIDAFLSKKKNIRLLYIIVSICILILAFGNTAPIKDMPEADGTALSEPLSEALPRVLSKIRGAGRVHVAISYESGAESVHARNEDGDGSELATLGSGSGERAVLEKEICPKVRGVIVVAEGGGNSGVRRDLLEATVALTGAPAHRIAVFPAK